MQSRNSLQAQTNDLTLNLFISPTIIYGWQRKNLSANEGIILKMILKRAISLLWILSLFLSISVVLAQTGNPGGLGAPDPDRPVGLTVTSEDVAAGYILIPIIQSKQVLLYDNDGNLVHIWEGEHYTGASVYLKENGNLIRTVSLDDNFDFGFNGQWGFVNGAIEEVNWEGEVVWRFDYASADAIGHHDIEIMPNGNILMIAFERFSSEEAIAMGRNPELLPEHNEMWTEQVIEIDPTTNEIVWQWDLSDHLIQDFDPDAANFGVVADNPQLMDVNYLEDDAPLQPNWWHVNSIDYNEALDQIVLSSRTHSEIWIIDHSISTEEAQGTAGDFLYRWGNPETYDAGDDADRTLYYQHDAQWIPDGYDGAGNILIFSNGGNERTYSDIIEISIPTDADGNYIMTAAEATAPTEYEWYYAADPVESFYSALISGMQRQPNGNTLITDGLNGRIFSVNPDGEIVWEFYLPPAVWAFRAERYDLPAFDELPFSDDLTFEGGVIWYADCADGTQARLHQYLIQENASMQLFMDTHGDDAEAQWQLEACAEGE